MCSKVFVGCEFTKRLDDNKAKWEALGTSTATPHSNATSTPTHLPALKKVNIKIMIHYSRSAALLNNLLMRSI